MGSAAQQGSVSPLSPVSCLPPLPGALARLAAVWVPQALALLGTPVFRGAHGVVPGQITESCPRFTASETLGVGPSLPDQQPLQLLRMHLRLENRRSAHFASRGS